MSWRPGIFAARSPSTTAATTAGRVPIFGPGAGRGSPAAGCFSLDRLREPWPQGRTTQFGKSAAKSLKKSERFLTPSKQNGTTTLDADHQKPFPARPRFLSDFGSGFDFWLHAARPAGAAQRRETHSGRQMGSSRAAPAGSDPAFAE